MRDSWYDPPCSPEAPASAGDFAAYLGEDDVECIGLFDRDERVVSLVVDRPWVLSPADVVFVEVAFEEATSPEARADRAADDYEEWQEREADWRRDR